ncbi:Coiled-coil domain-containing protein 96 [Papilio xuthus]|uniref:Coiled-coil domain-containing protein 96 n=1 Tax=Papilio xuthus TaxID=66420 RepID=A0A194QB24_PAPXU|nr:Coiled-coil domain-containing protein 96 [Papilio xuthus]
MLKQRPIILTNCRVIPKKTKSNLISTLRSSTDHGQSTGSNSSVVEDTEGDVGQIGKHISKGSVTINRDEYLHSHRELTHDYQQLKMKNNLLHRRFADYYKKRKLEHVLKPLENSADLEEKYQQKLFTYAELKDKEEKEIHDIKSKIQAVENQFKHNLENAEQKCDELIQLERSTGAGLIYSKTGKPMGDKTIERFLTLQRHKAEQAAQLCLRYIRVRNAVAELEGVIRKLETLGPGLHVAHFEQMYIDKQNYMNKIEEREDELIKNRTKCTEHNQILAHIREKMHHTDEVIDFTEGDLGDADLEFLKARERLGHAKGERDKLRWSLESERMKAGLLTRRDLLRDFQDATDEVVNLKERKSQLMNQITKIRHKLRESRRQYQFQPIADEELDNLS